MATKMNGRPYKNSKAEKRKLNTRMCLICGEEYEADYHEEGCICPVCHKEYKLPYHRKGSYPCTTRKICRKCAHRVRLSADGAGEYVCACLLHTGEKRDHTADDNHCATFEKKGVKKYADEQ